MPQELIDKIKKAATFNQGFQTVAIKIIAALLIWYIRIEAERGSVRDEILGRRASAAA